MPSRRQDVSALDVTALRETAPHDGRLSGTSSRRLVVPVKMSVWPT
jgi:hypothetical protein